MSQILIFLWLAGVILRIWRLARFFQLEGYDSRRYIRWLFSKITRILMWRALIFISVALLVAVLLGFFGQDSPALYLVIWGTAAVLSALPEPTKEVKQKFSLTQRAIRLLITAFALALIVMVGVVVIIETTADASQRIEFALVSFLGVIIYHLAPFILPLANVVNFPMEAGFRRMFRERARRTLKKAGPVVIGITGSVGKSTTKEVAAHVLSHRYSTLKNEGNYNNEIGLPVTILSLTEGHQRAVLELSLIHISEPTRPY